MGQLNKLAANNPLISLIKPLITRAMNKNIDRMTSFLDCISNDNGDIDIENILTEMTESLMESKPFTIKAPYIGDLEIGNGLIKINVPLTDKELVFDIEDIEGFKEALSSK